jgi:hypothetical protein
LINVTLEGSREEAVFDPAELTAQSQLHIPVLLPALPQSDQELSIWTDEGYNNSSEKDAAEVAI